MIRIGIDIGGTFTDLVLDQDGKRQNLKVLTTPQEPENGLLKGLEELLGQAGRRADEVGLIVHGTTLATNAVIERKGACTALVATEGFRDTIEIADEGRYDQYDIFIRKPRPLVPQALRFTVPERVDARGRLRLPLDEAAVAALAPRLRAMEVTSVAIAFMHAYAEPAHELRTRAILEPLLPGVEICVSSEVSPEIREYERTSTTCANAYVQPLMAGYLRRLETALQRLGITCPVYLMTSGGGVTTIDTAKRFPVRLVESGPAGGAILAAHVAAEAGERKVLSFDMGGTTAKLCLIEDSAPKSARSFEVDRSARFVKGSGLPLRIPVIEMIEIGAGGGSLARVDPLSRITTGPESAGAMPGPVAYGRGGSEPTVTDADLALGRLDAERFSGGRMKLDRAAAEAALLNRIGRPLGLDAGAAAFAVSEIVDENMANASRVHAVESGEDISCHAMVAFGGAAPLHACRVAEKLGIDRVIVPADAGVGSAVGFLLAPVAYEVVRSAHWRLDDFDPASANALLTAMSEEAHAVVRSAACDAPLNVSATAYMRYVGQGHEVAVSLPEPLLKDDDSCRLRQLFEAAYARQFQRIIPNGAIEILTWAVSVATANTLPDARSPSISSTGPRPRASRTLNLGSACRDVPVYRRDDFALGGGVAGPCLVEEATTTIVVGEKWMASMADGGHLVLQLGKGV